MASELYESRSIAITKGEYITLPEVPRQTLSAIMRGRIEEVSGWALYQTDANDDAIVRLKRAVGVLPGDSAWWRSSAWRLASALAKGGKDAEALDWYIRSYKGSTPNAFSYAVIEGLYKKLNGSTDGLDLKIGAKPVSAATPDAVAQKVEPTPTPETKAETSASPAESTKTSETPATSPTPAVVEETKSTPTPEPSPVPSVVPVAATASPTPSTTEGVKEQPTPTPVAETPKPTTEPTPIVTESPSPTPVATSTDTNATATPTPEEKPAEKADPQKETVTKELFPPVIISVPRPSATQAVKSPEPTVTPTPESPVIETKPTEASSKTPSEGSVAESRPRVVVSPTESVAVKPCTLTVSEETVTLQNAGGDLAVIVGRADDGEDLDGLTATSTDPDQVSVRREVIAGVKSRALFVLRPGARTGVFQVKFQLPCGKKEIVVRVR